jgi:hypothetical protein
MTTANAQRHALIDHTKGEVVDDGDGDGDGSDDGEEEGETSCTGGWVDVERREVLQSSLVMSAASMMSVHGRCGDGDEDGDDGG